MNTQTSPAAFTWWNDCPAIKNRATGEVIVVFYGNARGFQECVAVLKSVRAEVQS